MYTAKNMIVSYNGSYTYIENSLLLKRRRREFQITSYDIVMIDIIYSL